MDNGACVTGKPKGVHLGEREGLLGRKKAVGEGRQT